MAKSTEVRLLEEILILKSYILFPSWTRRKRSRELQLSESRIQRVLATVTKSNMLPDYKARKKQRKDSLQLIKQLEKKLYAWSKVQDKKKPYRWPNDWRTPLR